jgi:hypothetical protein
VAKPGHDKKSDYAPENFNSLIVEALHAIARTICGTTKVEARTARLAIPIVRIRNPHTLL